MDVTTSARKKIGFHHNDLRRNLIQVAKEAIERDGAAALNIRVLAKQLGVTHVALYRHFKDKAGLLTEVAESGFETLHAMQIAARDAAGEDALEGMVAMGQAYIDFARTNPKLFSFMFSTEALSGHDPQVNLADVVAQIKKCQDAGQIINVEPAKIIGAIVSAPHGFATFSALGWTGVQDSGAKPPSARSLLMLSLHPFLSKPPNVIDILDGDI